MTKDSYQPDYIIRKRRKATWYWSWAGFVLIILLGSIGLGYWLSERQYRGFGSANERLGNLRSQLEESNNSLIHWQQQYQVEHQVTGQLKKEIQKLNTQIHNLEKEKQAFLRIFDPNAVESGLQIASFVWESVGGKVDEFSFRLMLIQAGQQQRDVSGSYSITLVGKENGKDKSYSLQELEALSLQDTQFKFRYVGSHRGTFNIPENFEPELVRVQVTSSGRGGETLLQDYPWQDSSQQQTPNEVEENNVG